MTLWAALRRPDTGGLPRVVASVIAALAFPALAIITAWCYATWFTNWGRLTDLHLVLALCAAALGWVASISWVWSCHRTLGTSKRALLDTIRLAVVVFVVCAVLVLWNCYDWELLIVAFLSLATTLLLLIWTPVLLAATRGRSPRTADGEIDVRCPTCGYALNGLRDLRCPECGSTFTIDSLIEAQRYDGSGRLRTANTSKPTAA